MPFPLCLWGITYAIKYDDLDSKIYWPSFAVAMVCGYKESVQFSFSLEQWFIYIVEVRKSRKDLREIWWRSNRVTVTHMPGCSGVPASLLLYLLPPCALSCIVIQILVEQNGQNDWYAFKVAEIIYN